METDNLDSSLENADWMKQAWDLPAYKSADFLALYPPGPALDSFKKLPVYAAAVANGLIHDDEWVADYIQ